MFRVRGAALVIVVMVAFGGCGSGAEPVVEPTAMTSIVATTAPSTTSTAAPPTTAPPNNAPPTTIVPATTATPQPLRVIETRNPVPENAASYVLADERFDGAIALPDGSLLVAVRAAGMALCSSTIWHVDPRNGERSMFAMGRDPQVSPDGRTVVFASVRRLDTGDHSCTALEPALHDLASGAETVVPFGRDSTDGAIAYGHRWSPDGRFVTMSVGFDFSEGAGSVILDVTARSVSSLRMVQAVEGSLNQRVGAAPGEPWELYARSWLSDGTLVAGATCCFGQADLDRSAVPTWWRVHPGESVRSIDDAVTEPALLAQLPATIFE
jgi:hypothetical protein